MEDLASMRYNIINPMIITFVEQEKKFFGTCFSLINNFYNGMYKLQGQVPYQKSNYDPMKYTRASKIMEGVDTNSLPAIKMKAKYSYDDYKNNLQRANSCATNNISTSTFNNFGNNNSQTMNKKFSFEEYKARKSSVDYANKNNLNNNNMNTNMNINNNDNNSNNPYSYEAYRKMTQSLGNSKRPQINNNDNNQNNYYNKNMNIVMNSILGEENSSAKNPFGNIRNNPYSSNNNNSNNPYSNIFNSSHNNSNSNNNYGSIFGNNQQNNNNDNNNRFRKPPNKYNFGF
jgi:hypothetical protein